MQLWGVFFFYWLSGRSIEKFHMSGLHFRVPNTCCCECDLCKPHISTRVTFSDVNIKVVGHFYLICSRVIAQTDYSVRNLWGGFVHHSLTPVFWYTSIQWPMRPMYNHIATSMLNLSFYWDQARYRWHTTVDREIIPRKLNTHLPPRFNRYRTVRWLGAHR